MTASVLLFDAHVPGDPALENSHFIAERTQERIGEEAATLTYPQAVRAALEEHLGQASFRGIALFGHGDAGRLHTTLRMQHQEPSRIRASLEDTSEAGAVYGSDGEPALDLRNLPLLKGRWCHALACNVGLSLADRAMDAGAACFVAYETSLTPEYEADALPPPLRAHLVALVTSTTFHLHRGVRDEIALKERVQEVIETLEEWLDSDEGAAWIDGRGTMEVAGLRGLARQLRRDMVVKTAPS